MTPSVLTGDRPQSRSGTKATAWDRPRGDASPGCTPHPTAVSAGTHPSLLQATSAAQCPFSLLPVGPSP